MPAVEEMTLEARIREIQAIFDVGARRFLESKGTLAAPAKKPGNPDRTQK